MKALAIVAALTASASARPIHGSAGAGTSFLVTGDDGDRGRFDAEVDLEPGSRFGGLVALRAFDGTHHGLACAGLVYEAAAARPTLVIDLHGDIGFDLDQHAPVFGGGIRTTITAIGPIGVAFDTGGYLVLDGVDRTRFAISTGAALVARW